MSQFLLKMNSNKNAQITIKGNKNIANTGIIQGNCIVINVELNLYGADEINILKVQDKLNKAVNKSLKQVSSIKLLGKIKNEV